VNVIRTDIGRPISHLSANLKDVNLAEDAAEVLKTLAFKKAEVQTHDGHWYSMRIAPYRTINNVIDGVVITFVDVHDQKLASEKINELKNYAQDIVETVREPLLVLNQDLRVQSANGAFYNTFKVSPKKTEGELIYNLGNHQWDIPKLRELLEKILPEKNNFEDYEVEHTFPKIGHKKMRLNARKVVQKTEGIELILLAIEDEGR
jgi:two-component system CheB/CheR fusion protein